MPVMMMPATSRRINSCSAAAGPGPGAAAVAARAGAALRPPHRCCRRSAAAARVDTAAVLEQQLEEEQQQQQLQRSRPPPLDDEELQRLLERAYARGVSAGLAAAAQPPPLSVSAAKGVTWRLFSTVISVAAAAVLLRVDDASALLSFGAAEATAKLVLFVAHDRLWLTNQFFATKFAGGRRDGGDGGDANTQLLPPPSSVVAGLREVDAVEEEGPKNNNK